MGAAKSHARWEELPREPHLTEQLQELAPPGVVIKKCILLSNTFSRKECRRYLIHIQKIAQLMQWSSSRLDAWLASQNLTAVGYVRMTPEDETWGVYERRQSLPL
jgi:hypothetical protein